MLEDEDVVVVEDVVLLDEDEIVVDEVVDDEVDEVDDEDPPMNDKVTVPRIGSSHWTIETSATGEVMVK